MTKSRNVVASVLARLRNFAAAGGLSFNDVLTRYMIERFLARVARSVEVDSVLLKGALMLSVWGVPRARPTMDIDLLRRGPADPDSLKKFVIACVTLDDADDGVTFDPSTLIVEPIAEDTEYTGTRVRLLARMGNVKQFIQIDFGVGDAVHPNPQWIEYPVLLNGPALWLRAYPVEAAIAEKFHAMVELDLRNSRMKDFYDIWVLSNTLTFQSAPLAEAIQSTFANRRTDLPVAVPKALTAAFHGDDVHRRQWRAFMGRIGEPADVPSLESVALAIERFLMPLAGIDAQSLGDSRWGPGGPWSANDARDG